MSSFPANRRCSIRTLILWFAAFGLVKLNNLLLLNCRHSEQDEQYLMQSKLNIFGNVWLSQTHFVSASTVFIFINVFKLILSHFLFHDSNLNLKRSQGDSRWSLLRKISLDQDSMCQHQTWGLEREKWVGLPTHSIWH